MTNIVKAGSLKNGDRFEDITPGSNGGEYIANLIGPKWIGATPVGRPSEDYADFSVNEDISLIESAKMITKLKRFQGCLLGLAAGDAVGTTGEFKKRGTCN